MTPKILNGNIRLRRVSSQWKSTILHTIYALAIKHRLDPSSMDDVAEGEVVTLAPSIKTKGTAKRTCQSD
jgi:hypothetical protein